MVTTKFAFQRQQQQQHNIFDYISDCENMVSVVLYE